MSGRARRVGVGVCLLVYAGSLFLVWCETPSGVGLFGRPVSPVDLEKFGIDYRVEGWGGTVVLATGAALAFVGRLPRLSTAGAGVVALGALARLVLGDHQASSVGRVWLHGSWGAALASAAALTMTGLLLGLARRRPGPPAPRP